MALDYPRRTSPPTGSVDLVRPCFLNAVALVVMALGMAQTRHQAAAMAALPHGGSLPVAVAGYVASVLISVVALQMALPGVTTGRRLVAALASMLWSAGNAGLAAYCLYQAFATVLARWRFF